MEGEVKTLPATVPWVALLTLSVALSLPAPALSQDRPQTKTPEQSPQLRLEKTVKSRVYQGKTIGGEERLIKPGESLWQILVREKRLPERRFAQYVAVIEALNPRLKGFKSLPAGQTIFIPNRPDDLLASAPPPKTGATYAYRVKPGDYLYKLLREQMGAETSEQLRDASQQIKDLNPRKKSWETLLAGETIILPSKGQGGATDAPEAPKTIVVVGSDFAKKLPARKNVNLLEQIMGDLGNTLQKEGEETLSTGQGKVRINLASYPMIRNPQTARRVLLDLEGKISPSLQKEMEKTDSTVSIVAIRPGASVHDAINQLLSRLGFEFIPADRPMVISEGGTGVRVSGEWVVTAPDATGDNHEVLVINLTDSNGTTPDSLKNYLSSRGTMLKEILLPAAYAVSDSPSAGARNPPPAGSIQNWPSGKEGLVDAVLGAFQISFSGAHKVSLTVGEGIQVDAQVDRLFEYHGKTIALLYAPVPEETKKALGESEKAYPVDLDVKALSPRDLISRILATLGEKSIYEENRFSVFGDPGKSRLVVTLSGFYLPDRSLLITDGRIPQPLQRFFLDKGLRVASFH